MNYGLRSTEFWDTAMGYDAHSSNNTEVASSSLGQVHTYHIFPHKTDICKPMVIYFYIISNYK